MKKYMVGDKVSLNGHMFIVEKARYNGTDDFYGVDELFVGSPEKPHYRCWVPADVVVLHIEEKE